MWVHDFKRPFKYRVVREYFDTSTSTSTPPNDPRDDTLLMSFEVLHSARRAVSGVESSVRENFDFADFLCYIESRGQDRQSIALCSEKCCTSLMNAP